MVFDLPMLVMIDYAYSRQRTLLTNVRSLLFDDNAKYQKHRDSKHRDLEFGKSGIWANQHGERRHTDR